MEQAFGLRRSLKNGWWTMDWVIQALRLPVEFRSVRYVNGYLKKVFPRDFPIASRAWLSPPERQFPSLKETGKTASSSNYLWRIMQNCPAKPWNPVVPLRNSLPVISIPSSNRYFMSPTEMLVALSFPGIVIKSLPWNKRGINPYSRWELNDGSKSKILITNGWLTNAEFLKLLFAIGCPRR